MNEKTLICCVLLSLLSINEGRTEPFEQRELTDAQVDVEAAKQNMQSIELKKIALQERLTEVEKHYGETAALLKTLQAQIDQARQNLGKNQQERAIYQREIDQYRKELSEQIKAAYAMGRKEKLQIMLNQQDPVLSSRMMLYYNYINKARLKKLNDLKLAIAHQSQLNKQKETETQRLTKGLEQRRAEQLVLNEAKKQRKLLLNQLLRDFSSHQHRLADLKASEAKLKRLISSLQDEKNALATKPAIAPTPETSKPLTQINGDFSVQQGKLQWPVNGTVRKFGSARAKGLWDGVLISASEGTEVKAVAQGKVAYADPLQGYGSLIIIDHGQGYMTVHGFNQSLYKHVGDWVAAGDVIASVGKSGGRKQSGLYFAIRKQGMPIDPLVWCIKQNK